MSSRIQLKWPNVSLENWTPIVTAFHHGSSHHDSAFKKFNERFNYPGGPIYVRNGGLNVTNLSENMKKAKNVICVHCDQEAALDPPASSRREQAKKSVDAITLNSIGGNWYVAEDQMCKICKPTTNPIP